MADHRMRIINTMPRLILGSPAHRLLSGRYLTLTFTGRTSGRSYTTPAAYVQSGRRLLISTDSPWWRNVAAGQRVTVRLRGTDHRGTSSRISGPAALQALKELAAIPGYPRTAGMTRVAGVVPDDEIRRAAERRIVLAIELAGSR